MWHWVCFVLSSLKPFRPCCINANLFDVKLLSNWSGCGDRADEWRWFEDNFIELSPFSFLNIRQICLEKSACFCSLSVTLLSEESIRVTLVFFYEFFALIGSLAVPDYKAIPCDFAWLYKAPSSSLSKQLRLLSAPHTLIGLIWCVRATANWWSHYKF